MLTFTRAALLTLFVLAPATAREGLYTLTGTDSALGPYRGRVEIRATGGGAFRFVREATYQNQVQGRTLTTIWEGTATPRSAELDVRVELERFGWITAVPGLQRTAADNAPVVVTGAWRPDAGGGWAGVLTGAGVSVSEALVPAGPVGAAPIFQTDVRFEALHRAPPSWLRWALFLLFDSLHRTPAVQRWVSDPRFQAAVHQRLIDRTGFAWLRNHPQERLLVNQVVDAITVTEAEIRRSAYGLKLHEKAALYDRDAETRHRDVTGLIAAGVRQTPNGLEPMEDMSTFLWSACYLYGQSCRYELTRDPQALANVELIATRLCDMIEIDPAVGEFARSLRPIGRSPIAGSWHAGTGNYAQWAWHDNGNNDMVKGVWIGFLGAWRSLPQNHPLRPRIVACVKEIADHWATSSPTGGVTGNRRGSDGNKLMNNMLAFYVTREPAYEQAYKRALRKPLMLLELVTGGTFQAYGIADWSGTHLSIVGKIALIELGRELRSSWVPLFQQAIRGGHGNLKEYWRSTLLWSVAAAGYNGNGDGRVNTHLGLQEWPHPKPHVAIDNELNASWCPSPWPSLPWKMDWTQQNGYARRQSLISYPVFMTSPSNYMWRSSPLPDGSAASDVEHPGADFTFAYWLGRKLGVIAATD